MKEKERLHCFRKGQAWLLLLKSGMHPNGRIPLAGRIAGGRRCFGSSTFSLWELSKWSRALFHAKQKEAHTGRSRDREIGGKNRDEIRKRAWWRCRRRRRRRRRTTTTATATTTTTTRTRTTTTTREASLARHTHVVGASAAATTELRGCLPRWGVSNGSATPPALLFCIGPARRRRHTPPPTLLFWLAATLYLLEKPLSTPDLAAFARGVHFDLSNPRSAAL